MNQNNYNNDNQGGDQGSNDFIFTRAYKQGTTKSGKMNTDTVFIPADQTQLLLERLQQAIQDGGGEGVAITFYHGTSQKNNKPYTTVGVRGLTPPQQRQGRQNYNNNNKQSQGQQRQGGGNFPPPGHNKRPFNPGR